MAELDLFETRFAAAYRRYLDEAPTQVDAVEIARSVVSMARGRRLSWGTAFRSMPAPAWLVLLAILLTALGAALFAGSQRDTQLPAVVVPMPPAFACPPGSTPDQPGPADQARPQERPGYPPTMAFDRRAGKVVALVTLDRGVETWTIDACTNTWMQMHPRREPSGDEWSQLVYDVDSDVTIGVSSGRVWSYHLEANTWTLMRSVPPTGAWPRAYDPVSGLVVATVDPGDPDAPAELATYDVETDRWAPIHQENGPGWLWGMCAYDTSVDRLVEVTGGDLGWETWLLDIRTGRWSRSGAGTPRVEPNWVVPAIAYDEAAERTVVVGNAGMAAYDATADRWETIVEASSPGGFRALPLVYDPVNRRLVGFGWKGQGTGLNAFDLVTREWIVLSR